MRLHENRELFKDYITSISQALNYLDPSIVEKDYYVTLFLKKIMMIQPNIIFKGGTSLTKCYKIINRFSEDIDLNVDTESAKLTEGDRKKLKRDILNVISETGFELKNPDDVRSRREFNRYIIGYPTVFQNEFLKPDLIVETAVFIKSFPTEKMLASSFIYDFLNEHNAENEIKEYQLEPFLVKVQSLERTFLDKVFAIADYYLSDTVDSHSRHIYDLYKLYPLIMFNEKFKLLINDVREARKPHIDSCLSAQNDVNLQELLQKIVDEETYKRDYNAITVALLFDSVPYNDVIHTLQTIIDTEIFKK
jgi:predicted nucleotidyltransferase component of viral defense system